MLAAAHSQSSGVMRLRQRAEHREQQEDQRQHHADVQGAQIVGRDDRCPAEERRPGGGGVEVEHRYEDGKGDDGLAEPAAELVGGALLLLDQLLDLAALVLGQLTAGQHLVEGYVATARLGGHRILPPAGGHGGPVLFA